MQRANGKSWKGRGSGLNPTGRFERLEVVPDPEWGLEDLEEQEAPATRIIHDHTASIVAHNNSPDVGFDYSINVYRGCEHGCAYCYARPTHEYFGFSAGLDFETRIIIKPNAPALLRDFLNRKGWKPQVIAMSGVTDPYQPLERQFQLTRGCLKVLAEARNPVSIITKNHLVTRDIDLLAELARHSAVQVTVSVTSLDPSLTGSLEPRTSRPKRRLEAIRKLSGAGIPVKVMAAPMIPGLNDSELASILEAAAAAGAKYAGFLPVRLPYGVKDIFENWLETHFPERKGKVLGRIRQIRGGSLNDSRFCTRMKGEGIWMDLLARQFEIACRRHGLISGQAELNTGDFRRTAPEGREQLTLFDT